ncbi:MAG: DUF2071 domain-containing protein [Planctomycetaceae bacterium]|nr:DUF2071 domain-containing protein [Planctomycetaceae bacterium]
MLPPGSSSAGSASADVAAADAASLENIAADPAGGPPAPLQLSGPVAGYQKWRQLLFLHWRVPASEVQPLLPAPLEVETHDGSAWLGLVLFTMQGIRPRWFPAVPLLSNFHETNVRTYVRHPPSAGGNETGVWFFSLDAACSPAVRVARWKWHLPYFRSRMSLEQQDNRVKYTSTRLWPGPAGASTDVTATLGEPQPEERTAGSLNHFLVDRYTLFTRGTAGQVYSGQVAHPPYPLQAATVEECEETLVAAAGLSVSGPPDHAVFSSGVDVRIGALRPAVR